MGKLYNLKQLEELSGGNNEFVLEIISVFLSDVPKQLKEINDVFNQHNCKELSNKAHKLKPSIDLLGIKTISKDIRLIENNSSDVVNKSDIPKLIKNVQSVLNTVIQDLRRDLNLQ